MCHVGVIVLLYRSRSSVARGLAYVWWEHSTSRLRSRDVRGDRRSVFVSPGTWQVWLQLVAGYAIASQSPCGDRFFFAAV